MRNLLLATVFAFSLAACSDGGGRYYADRYGPPAPRYGAVGYAPGPGYVWCDGYWDRRGSAWNWSNGYWARPPYVSARWQPSYWRPNRGGYVFHRGRWR